MDLKTLAHQPTSKGIRVSENAAAYRLNPVVRNLGIVSSVFNGAALSDLPQCMGTEGVRREILAIRGLQSELQEMQLQEGVLRDLSVEQSKDLLLKVQKRLVAETDYFDELKDIGLSRGLMQGFKPLEQRLLLLQLDTKLTKKIFGEHSFIPELGVLVVSEKLPSPNETLKFLFNTGSYPLSLSKFHHGLLKASQWSPGKRVALMSTNAVLYVVGFGIRATFRIAYLITKPLVVPILKLVPWNKAKEILNLSHAAYASLRCPSSDNEDINTLGELRDRIVKDLNRGNKEKVEVTSALRSIHALSSLGLTHVEIARILPGVRYDAVNDLYPKLEIKIALLRQNKGLRDGAMFKEFLSIKEEEFILRHERHQLEAKLAVRDEIRKYLNGSKTE